MHLALPQFFIFYSWGLGESLGKASSANTALIFNLSHTLLPLQSFLRHMEPRYPKIQKSGLMKLWRGICPGRRVKEPLPQRVAKQ
jgi:hypothetical protein